MNPTTIDNFSIRQYIYLSGGIFFNFITFFLILILLNLGLSFEPLLQDSLLIFAYLSLVIAVANSLPINFGENLLDGRKIYYIHSNQAYLNCLKIVCLDNQGIRPKDWVQYNVFEGYRDEKYSEFDYYLKLFELQSFIDLKKEKSVDALNTLLIRLKYCSNEIHDSILITGALYYTFCDYRIDYVEKLLSLTRIKFKPNLLSKTLLDVIVAKVKNEESRLEKETFKLFKILEESFLLGTKDFYSELIQ